jgi:hypothetical protein
MFAGRDVHRKTQQASFAVRFNLLKSHCYIFKNKFNHLRGEFLVDNLLKNDELKNIIIRSLYMINLK